MSAVVVQEEKLSVAVLSETVSVETLFAESFQFPADSLKVGTVVRVTARGVHSTSATPTTLTMRLKLGSVVLVATGAVAFNASKTNKYWEFSGEFIVCAVGAGTAGKIEAQGVWWFLEATAAGALLQSAPNTAQVSFDSTVAQTLQMSAQFSATTAGNSVQLRQLIVEVLS